MPVRITFDLQDVHTASEADEFLRAQIRPGTWGMLSALTVVVGPSANIDAALLLRSVKSLNLTEGVKRALMESQQHNYLGVYVRTPACDIATLGELSQMTASQLLQYKGIGDGKLTLIRNALREHGLNLAD